MSQRKAKSARGAKRAQFPHTEANVICPVSTHMLKDGSIICVDWRNRTAAYVPSNRLPTAEALATFTKESFAEHAYAACRDLALVSADGQVTAVAPGLPIEFQQYVQEVVNNRRTAN